MTETQFWMIARIVGVALLTFFVVGYVLILFYLIVSLIHTAFPTWISGQTEATPNYVRNSLELVYFLANSVVALVAVYAVRFAKQQSKEAENARLANIYTTIEARWAGPDIKVSRMYFRNLINEYCKDGKTLDLVEFPRFINEELHKISRSDSKTYMDAMAIIDFIEYLGMLEDKKYLRIDDLEPLIGEVLIQYDNFVGSHIQQIRDAYQTQARNQNLTKVPDTYVLFSRLAEKFRARFSK
jgi:hypothetical protein